MRGNKDKRGRPRKWTGSLRRELLAKTEETDFGFAKIRLREEWSDSEATTRSRNPPIKLQIQNYKSQINYKFKYQNLKDGTNG